jgi:hypothetical protein
LLRNDRFGGVLRAGSSNEASFAVFAFTQNKKAPEQVPGLFSNI